MQAQSTQNWNRSRGAKRPRGNGGLGRAIRYLGKHRRTTLIAYFALLIASIAQLGVPKLTQNMISAVTNGTIANTVLNIEAPIPALTDTARQLAAEQMGKTLEQIQLEAANAESLLIGATLLIILFAIVQGVFAFVQAYMAEKTSQGVAFDFRNELFAKIQRLSFSYHDQNQTGQLMIRATDDVEKVRMFIAQGLIMMVQSFILLAATLIILFTTNWRLTLAILPTLPFALVLFMIFGALTQPLFREVQQRISALNTVLQESLAGIKVVKAFVREPYEQQRFDRSADNLLTQQLKISRTFAFLFPVIFLIAQLGQAAILYFGGQQIIGGTLDLGGYQEFSMYLMFVFFPLGQLGFMISLMAQASASAS
ncbi:MAG TPA: ABC transporter ATP-binding protein, partial [Phototrophicaceae bacterium]|nr:ABC transporter ATP-binding protein [Phototrophicaceae bacterium]